MKNKLCMHIFVAGLVFSLLAGCSFEPVRPWERGILAQKKMQIPADALEAFSDEHIYFSKEAASGGQGIGGGGCGCN
jgi:hypothetical protein